MHTATVGSPLKQKNKPPQKKKKKNPPNLNYVVLFLDEFVRSQNWDIFLNKFQLSPTTWHLLSYSVKEQKLFKII